MKYDITKPVAPAMPSLGKGTECFKLLLSQTSFDMHAPLLPMLPPVLGTKISNAEFQYPSGQWFEMCGQQAALIADSAGNKGQLGLLVEACNRDFREQDAEELKKYLQKNLALYKIPREFHEVEALPRTSTGKIAKNRIIPEYQASKKK